MNGYPGVLVESVSSDSVFDSVNVTFKRSENEEVPSAKIFFDGKSPPAAGFYSAKFILQVSGVNQAIGVNAYLTVLDRLEVAPSCVNFGLGDRKSLIDKQVQVSDRRDMAIHAVNLDSGPKCVTLQSVEMDKGSAKLNLRCDTSGIDEFLSETLQLSVTLLDGTVETIHLPVLGRTFHSAISVSEECRSVQTYHPTDRPQVG